MEKIKYSILMILFCGICTWNKAGIVVCAQEAQVIYDFIEVTEDTPVYVTPNHENKTNIVIPKNEKVLVISQTGDGWYQILYHEEILYIKNQAEVIEEAELGDEVIEEIEQNRADKSPTQEEIEMLIGNTSDNDMDVDRTPQILIGVVTLIALSSGIGYLYISRKEKLEEVAKRQAEVTNNDR